MKRNCTIPYPQRKLFRQRAHSNPFSFHNFKDFPLNPKEIPLGEMYPSPMDRKITVLDVGCGYGGLLCALGDLFREKLCIGLEIRVKVSDFTQKRISFEREQENGKDNVWCLRANVMRHLPYYFEKAQLEVVVIAFPDPHFKVSKQKRRIISREMLPEFAYVMAVGAILYTATDVKSLAEDMKKAIDEFPLFERIENWKDIEQHLEMSELMINESDEAKKAALRSGDALEIHFNVYQRIERPFSLQ